MDFKIVFCSDGVLRVQWLDKPLVPLQCFFEKEDNRYFWFDWLDREVIFEKGLTIGAFIKCLSVDYEFWSHYTGKNLLAYAKESITPCLVKEEKIFDWISLGFFGEISPLVEYAASYSEEAVDFSSWLNADSKKRLTGTWDIDFYYRVNGFVLGQSEQYGIEDVPFNQMRDVPLVLDLFQKVIISERNIDDCVGEGKKLLNQDAYGVRSVSWSGTSGVTKYLLVDKVHYLKDVVNGFFHWFNSSPKQRDEFTKHLQENFNKIKDVESEQSTSTSNVVDIFSKEPVIDDGNEDAPSDKKLKVVVSDNAFDSVINHYQRNDDYFDEMLNKAKANPDMVIKIGEVKSSSPLEERVFGLITKYDNLSSDFC